MGTVFECVHLRNYYVYLVDILKEIFVQLFKKALCAIKSMAMVPKKVLRAIKLTILESAVEYSVYGLLGIVRVSLLAIGIFSVCAGLIGLIPAIPLLPTVPFMLLARWCFRYSSPILYDMVYSIKYVGPALRDWDNHKRISVRIKLVSSVTILATVGFTLYGSKTQLSKIVYTLFALGVITFILTRKSK